MKSAVDPKLEHKRNLPSTPSSMSSILKMGMVDSVLFKALFLSIYFLLLVFPFFLEPQQLLMMMFGSKSSSVKTGSYPYRACLLKQQPVPT